MKFTLPQLKIGDCLPAQVEEILSPNEMIVNFNGDLIRVSNQSEKTFHAGQEIRLRVVQVKPLSFRLELGRPRGYSSHI